MSIGGNWDNEYDKEAIQVKVKGLGKIGYVANSPNNMSATWIHYFLGMVIMFRITLIAEELEKTWN